MTKRKNKITLLLGAGFACHMKGLSTLDINTLFAQDLTFLEKQLPLYTFVEDNLLAYYSDYSFETFLAVLERILDYKLGVEYLHQTSTQDRDLVSVLFSPNNDFKKSKLFTMTAHELWHVFVHYINSIIDAVSRYDCVDNCPEEAKSFQEFISSLRSQYDKVKLYSTNYDTLCPQLLSKESIYTSTIRSASFPYENDFIYNLARFNNAHLTYFPLHGCTKFKRGVCNCIKWCELEQRLNDIAIDNSAGNPNGFTLFTPIISGYNKLQHINGKPFIFGTTAFANDLQDSEEILTLGYSYRDPHINSYLSTFSKVKPICVTIDPVMHLPVDLNIEENLMDISIYFNSRKNLV